ncbi:LysR family transcriptional regulator [Bradyrhizobium sp. PRIMUS42]|uniref:LysR family transcriptional regulator n=1 Tax=Bradyrhizobium sp. PRIMUS42 TaxID=2908926 RepID=UPI001FF37F9B|nr:LysR family transcriptional regulator [Bradyrhizobium sp. PRIMUS42]MCJ9729662.1 LysR substrate-binding domain-containing protein [Bradyrhizobium sp. PRIMUS42]
MDRLLQLEVFSKTAELGSLTKAAETLRMSNAAASRHLSALEERLAVRLIERNTRRQWLTEVGHELLQRCGTILNELAEAEDAVSDRALSPTGTLRVTSSLSFAMIYLTPMLPAFRALYPKLAVQIIAANRYPDFIEAGIDVAIRTREHEPDSNIIVRRIGQMRRVLAAAPSYLARQGRPEQPADLARHDMLIYSLANDRYSLRLSKGNAVQTVRIAPTLDSNDGQVIRGAALAGLGILIQPLYIVQGDVLAGQLEPILMDWELPLLTMNIAYQNRVRLPAKIRVFSDFLVNHIREHSLAGIWMDATRQATHTAANSGRSIRKQIP